MGTEQRFSGRKMTLRIGALNGGHRGRGGGAVVVILNERRSETDSADSFLTKSVSKLTQTLFILWSRRSWRDKKRSATDGCHEGQQKLRAARSRGPMKSRYRQVIFMDDFFRSADNGLIAHPANRRFLRGLFESAASRLGMACSEEFASSDGGRIDVAAAMAALSLPCSTEGWAQAVTADLEAACGPAHLPEFDKGCLIIGWGMPPSLLNLVDRRGATFIDLEIDPVRFSRHLAFCARTNDPAVAHVLAALRIGEDIAWNDAAALRGYFARRGASHVLDPRASVGLFVGQTAVDLALIENGRLARPMDALEGVQQLAREVDLLLIKRHPYEASTEHLVELAAELPNAVWTQQNVYALMCADNLRFVCGLSSGTLSEAAHFLIPAKALIRPDRNARGCLPPSCSDWIAVAPNLASIQAMSEICEAHPYIHRAIRVFATNATTRDLSASIFREDALDHAFGFRWGLDGAQTGLALVPALQMNRSYDFCADGPTIAWLGEGWSTPEPWGVWNAAEQAYLAIPVERAVDEAGGECEVLLSGHLFHPAGERPPRVLMRIAGEAFGEWIEAEVAEAVSDSAVELRARWRPSNQRAVLLIELRLEGGLRPVDFGVNADDRRLALGLHQLRVTRVDGGVKPAMLPRACQAPDTHAGTFAETV